MLYVLRLCGWYVTLKANVQGYVYAVRGTRTWVCVYVYVCVVVSVSNLFATFKIKKGCIPVPGSLQREYFSISTRSTITNQKSGLAHLHRIIFWMLILT